MAEAAAAATKVHFDREEADEFHSNELALKFDEERKVVDVHLGFLQIYHKYEVSFKVPAAWLPSSGRESLVPTIGEPPNLNCRIVKVQDDPEVPGSVAVKVELTAHKAKLMKESASLRLEGDPSQTVGFTLHSRVLGKGKGTPMLKEGVRGVGTLPDPEDSDVASDWQGFA